jgi:drug/metabolite transporter (DMT)-like permease
MKMEDKRRNTGALVGGSLLILFGLLALLTQLFSGFDFWGTFWPFLIMGVGAMFFVGMFAGGKSVAGLAIPGSIIMVVGLMLFIQNLTNHWESWSYSWTVILIAVGLGIYIMGLYAGSQSQRQSGVQVMKVGLVMFILFGAFFEMIFNSFGLSNMLFPVALILLGLYLLVTRSGMLSFRRDKAVDENTEDKNISE